MLIVVGLIIGLCLLFLAIGFMFNPGRVTSDQIVAAPEPSDISLSGQDFAVQPVKLGHPNVYFIQTTKGYIMVDVGMPNQEKQLDEVFDKAGVDPKSVKLIILTHGHMDHVGSIAYAKKVTGADVLCHQSYAQDLESGVIEPAVARNLTGRLLNLMTGLLGTKFEGVKPDIAVADEFDLSEYGIAGKTIHTPGHSPSSLSIMLGNGEALVGDIVREEEPDVIGIGMFYDDEQALLGSLQKIAAYEPSIIYLSHGNYIDNLALANAIETIKAESGD
jgi:glyoxylase-like metal-dependent hydrolase (beta-lactamase superfamily II)